VLIGYFKINGQVVFGIYLGLNVVGHFSDVVSGNHLPTVGVGGGDLGGSAFFQLLLQLLVFAALRLVFFDFLLGFIGVSGVAVFHGQFKVVQKPLGWTINRCRGRNLTRRHSEPSAREYFRVVF